jgi:hypothetical protein
MTLQTSDKIGQLATPMVTDKVLKICWRDPDRSPAAIAAAETDRP